MPSKGYKNLGVREDIYDRLKEEKGDGESFSAFLSRILILYEETKEQFEKGKDNGDLVSYPFITIKPAMPLTKEDLERAIKGLKSDINMLFMDAINNAFAETKRY